jgi:Peptidase_C39 like family
LLIIQEATDYCVDLTKSTSAEYFQQDIMTGIKAIAVAILFLVTFSGIPVGQVPPATLGVPLIAQHGHNWCWAATSEMCIAYYHDSIDHKAPFFTQCDLGKRWFIYYYRGNSTMLQDTLNMDCAPDSIEGSVFDLTSQPYFPPYPPVGTMRYFISSPQSTTPLNWQQLCDTFAAKKPVIFQWGAVQITDTTVAGSHCMVAEGCSQTPGMPQYQWVSVIDPWPMDDTTGHRFARHSQIAYSEYENTSNAAVIWKRSFVWRYRGPDQVIGKK